MHLTTLLVWILKLTVVLASPFQKKLHKRTMATAKPVGCMHMESQPGEYVFSADGSGSVCGLYLIGSREQLIEIEFLDFNIDCENGGLLAVVDGWELNGEFFPAPNDHHLSLNERYTEFCGLNKPRKVMLSSQNVALIQNRIPVAGQGFRVKVSFPLNDQPCNVITMFQQGMYTISNYGQKRNCTVSIIYPEKVRLVSVNVGVNSEQRSIDDEIALSSDTCLANGKADYVEILGGQGFYLTPFNRRAITCGLQSLSGDSDVVNPCSNTAVRLVSSGEYYNSVSFVYVPPSKVELHAESADTC